MKNDYELKYHFANRRNAGSFAEQDVFGLLPDVTEIVSITSFTVDKESRNKGIGSRVLKDFCNSYDDHLVLFTSGVMKSECPEEPEEEEFQTILDKQEEFLLKNDFISINGYVGYETRRAYIHNNKFGKRLLDVLVPPGVN